MHSLKPWELTVRKGNLLQLSPTINPRTKHSLGLVCSTTLHRAGKHLAAQRSTGQGNILQGAADTARWAWDEHYGLEVWGEEGDKINESKSPSCSFNMGMGVPGPWDVALCGFHPTVPTASHINPHYHSSSFFCPYPHHWMSGLKISFWAEWKHLFSL